MGRVALSKGTPALPLFRVAQIFPIVYDRALPLPLPPRRTLAPPPTPQSRPHPTPAARLSRASPPSPSPSSLAGTSCSCCLHPVPGDWVFSLRYFHWDLFEVNEAILIEKLNSVDYTENRHSTQLCFRCNTDICSS